MYKGHSWAADLRVAHASQALVAEQNRLDDFSSLPMAAGLWRSGGGGGTLANVSLRRAIGSPSVVSVLLATRARAPGATARLPTPGVRRTRCRCLLLHQARSSIGRQSCVERRAMRLDAVIVRISASCGATLDGSCTAPVARPVLLATPRVQATPRSGASAPSPAAEGGVVSSASLVPALSPLPLFGAGQREWLQLLQQALAQCVGA